jgi:hypothetical protein
MTQTDSEVLMRAINRIPEPPPVPPAPPKDPDDLPGSKRPAFGCKVCGGTFSSVSAYKLHRCPNATKRNQNAAH